MVMAATIPVATSPTSSSPPPSLSPPRNTRHASSPSLLTPGINDTPVIEETRGRTRKVVRRREKEQESARFRLSKLLQFNNNQNQYRQQQQGQLSERELSSSPREPPQQQPPQQQQQQHQQKHHHHSHHHQHQHIIFSSKHNNTPSRFRRGSFLGFLQSHYHVFHRRSEQREPAENKETLSHTERERHRRNNTAVSPRSPTSSMFSTGSSSNLGSKSPHTTIHSGYNVTISDFRAHETIASTCSSTVPTKVTDINYGGVNRQTDMNPIFIPTTTPVNQQTDSISVTLNPHDKSGMLPLTSSPNSKRGSIKSSLRALGFFSKSNSSNPAVLSTSMPNRSLSHNAASSHSNQLYSYEEVDPHHGFLKDRHKSSSPSRHISRVLEAGAARIGLFKKKQSFPDHYLSLPVGGVASSAANGMYMLHSEDLSVTEFAKLAGITILPEDDEDDTETTDDPSVNDSSLESHGMTKNETGSSSNTVNSDRHLTTGSVGSNKLIRKTNIWDPLFWSEPSSDDGGSRSVAASTSSTSLLISPVSVSAPASPSLVSEMFGPEMFNTKESEKLSNSGNVDKFGSADTDSRGNENSSLIRRNSCTPCELRSGAGSGFSVDRSGFPSQVPPKRLDQMPNPSKELIDLSGHRMSFSSLTAAAIELGNDQKSSQDIGGEQQQQLQTRNVESAHMTFQPSDPADMAAKSSQRLAFSVAFHALQPTRSKQNANRRASFQPGSSKSARTRSPSPSPLSKQLEISDSEGFDSPMEEKDEFDFNVTPAVGSETVDSTLQAPSTITQAPKKSRFEVTHLTVDQAPPREKRAANLHHHNRTQSLPHILSDLPIHPPSPSSSSSSISSSSPPPSPSQSQSATLRPPNSVPTRKFAPGTKVGRFTLVEETCAKHTDVLRAQQEEEQNQQVMSQRRASMGDMGSSIYSDDDCSSEHSMDGTLMKAQWRTSAASGVEGAVLDSTNPALKLEENVLVFQRKKTRRLQQPQPQPQPET